MPSHFNFTSFLHKAIQRGNCEQVDFYLRHGASLTEQVDYKGAKKVAIDIFGDHYESQPLFNNRLEIANLIIKSINQKCFQNENDKAQIGLLFYILLEINAFDLAEQCIRPGVDLKFYTKDESGKNSRIKYTWDFLISAQRYNLLQQVIILELNKLSDESDIKQLIDKLMTSADTSMDLVASQIIIDTANNHTKPITIIISDNPCGFFKSPESSSSELSKEEALRYS